MERSSGPSERSWEHEGGSEATRVLEAAGRGDAGAGARLIEMLYDELRGLAASHLGRTPPGNTLQPTALVHEAYFKLMGERADGRAPVYEGRAHFFGAAARAMRDILVDQARRKAAAKRGGGASIRRRIDLSSIDELPEVGGERDDLPELDAALRKLEREMPRKAEIVMLRFYAGLTIEQAAEVLGVTERTVNRDWLFAKAWLQRELGRGEDPDTAG